MDTYLILHTKINSKCVKDINLRPRTLKFWQENICQKSYETGFGSDFSDMTLKTKATKPKIDKLDFIKI